MALRVPPVASRTDLQVRVSPRSVISLKRAGLSDLLSSFTVRISSTPCEQRISTPKFLASLNQTIDDAL